MSKEETPKTLNGFIDKYHDLLTAMGVFGGLTALFTQIEGGQFLAFITFLIFLVLGFELCTKFPKWSATINLFVFRVLTVVLMIGVTGYLAYFYFPYLILSSSYIAIAVAVAFGKILAPRIVNYLQTHKKTSTLVAIILTGLVALGVFLLAIFIMAIILVIFGFATF